ncbi:uncharacterized protein ZK1073.1-like isoform X1 [Amphibalanus amphitrite]|uniref:uncharacterized protein ZK1073.1-like isoform X1 n=1 Tax=Amphibalanus amphitrite TaxID=1232801 RepID=UPI001C9158F2|nr:uncharacterized protein ZK1073.1-like isoform X1 [Amphibalanus amphitrite]
MSESDGARPPAGRPPPLKTRSLSRQYSSDPVWVEEMKHVIDTKHCGPLTIYVQGDVSLQDKKAVFLTVHDLGCNHTSFHDFVEHPVMKEIKERSIFIHVDVPGQEDDAITLPDDFKFPTMQQLGEDMLQVLDTLKVNMVIGLGEGAGANILARFGLAYPDRVLGLVLVHCTSTRAGIMEYFSDKLMNWKLSSIGHHPSAEQYLVFHRFGNSLEEQLDGDMDASTREKLIKDFQDRLKSKINPRNLQRYVQCFLDRTDISMQVADLKMETLLVTGAKASHNHTVHTMHSHMNKAKSSLITLEGVGDVLIEAPEKFCSSMLLFCKGLGMLTSVNARARTLSSGSGSGGGGRNRSMSMEDYDKPNARRLSVTKS